MKSYRYFRIDGQNLPIRIEIDPIEIPESLIEISERFGQNLIPITKKEYKELFKNYNSMNRRD